MSIWLGRRARMDLPRWVPSLLAGLLRVAAAVVTVLWPEITVLALTVLAALLLIVVGVAEIVFGVRIRKAIRGEVLALAGLAGILQMS